MMSEIPHPPFLEKMRRFHGQMEQALYAAEQACIENKGYQNCCGCPFYCGCIVGSNRCDKLRAILGDPVRQHDPTVEAAALADIAEIERQEAEGCK